MLAVSRDGVLDKQTTAHDDLLDALRLSLKFYLPMLPLRKKRKEAS
jgi:hypothetical protein